METTKRPLVILTGPTAVGKTALSIALAKAIGGEIISADSMQVYRHMDIGSAKITPEEMEGIPHYLIDVLEPDQEFNVVVFQELAKQAAAEIYSRGHIPIVAGGTGFYIQALVYDIDFTENDEDTAFRRTLEEQAKREGAEALYERLRAVDPESCESIHAHNIKRVIRAIEFYEKTGKKISEHNREQRQNDSPYNFAYFVLNDDRERIYERINVRVDLMMAQGLVEEVRALRESGCRKEMVSMQGLGYKELLSYLEGETSMEEAVYLIKRDTRHFAKRQLTWFRREKEVIWVDKTVFDHDSQKILNFMQDFLREKGIIL
ncbi:MAG: tRNA (adenosine(37)-N6)-dimethylallyltransferase MiaA [Lachnospiraceae bacterium]|nr:tRNA (adenosine(37)-N6)-dimethylallyltransferase MiaA [Lachnospiraceae bacterium]RKI85260.1 tRNA (adenosine(37)-N6)-dimethylallyltransferase MiaA [bacterium 1xD42-87]